MDGGGRGGGGHAHMRASSLSSALSTPGLFSAGLLWGWPTRRKESVLAGKLSEEQGLLLMMESVGHQITSQEQALCQERVLWKL